MQILNDLIHPSKDPSFHPSRSKKEIGSRDNPPTPPQRGIFPEKKPFFSFNALPSCYLIARVASCYRTRKPSANRRDAQSSFEESVSLRLGPCKQRAVIVSSEALSRHKSRVVVA